MLKRLAEDLASVEVHAEFGHGQGRHLEKLPKRRVLRQCAIVAVGTGVELLDLDPAAGLDVAASRFNSAAVDGMQEKTSRQKPRQVRHSLKARLEDLGQVLDPGGDATHVH